MMDRKNHISTLRKWNKPLLMIAREFDSLVSLETSKKHLQFIPKTSFVELKGVGHMGIYEAPDEIKKLISALVCTISK